MTYYKGDGLKRNEPSGTPLSNAEEIKKLQKELAAVKKCCACSNKFGYTELNPPVDAPTGNDPLFLINRAEGLAWLWDGASWVEFGGGGADLSYYELVAEYSTDGSPTAHTFRVIQNTFPGVTWTAEDMPSTGIILHPSIDTYADGANNSKLILTGGVTYNGFTGVSIYCSVVYGSSPATDGLVIIPVAGDTGLPVGTADLDGGLLYKPLPIILRYYF